MAPGSATMSEEEKAAMKEQLEEEMKAKEAQEAANQRELELKKRLHDMELSSKAAEAENEREWKQKMVALEQTISATVNTAKQSTAAESCYTCRQVGKD